MTVRIEDVILRNLLYNDEYSKKFTAFLHNSYFADQTESYIFKLIKYHLEKYAKLPNKDALILNLKNAQINEEIFDNVKERIDGLEKPDKEQDEQWLLDVSEEWAKEQAIHNAIIESIGILDDNKKDRKNKKSKNTIPDLLYDALAVSFNVQIGHSYVDDAIERWEKYHHKDKRLPFDIEFFNRITDGGFTPKTLNVFLGGTGTGKTLVKCHLATHYLKQKNNVLYITMEMSEEKIAERIDANLLNISMNDIRNIPKDQFVKRVADAKSDIGQLYIKEYPIANANVGHFRNLLQELKIKKKFVPDIIFIDYVNICSSFRLAAANINNSYLYVKAVSEELRGMAQEYNVPVVTSSQVNRAGYGSSDPGLDNTSESLGLPFTADLMVAITTSEQLEKLGQLAFKQLKNRYTDVTKNKRFVVGVERTKMRLYDVSGEATDELVDNGSPRTLTPNITKRLIV